MREIKRPLTNIVHLYFIDSINKNGHLEIGKKERETKCSEKKLLSNDLANF